MKEQQIVFFKLFFPSSDYDVLHSVCMLFTIWLNQFWNQASYIGISLSLISSRLQDKITPYRILFRLALQMRRECQRVNEAKSYAILLAAHNISQTFPHNSYCYRNRVWIFSTSGKDKAPIGYCCICKICHQHQRNVNKCFHFFFLPCSAFFCFVL